MSFLSRLFPVRKPAPAPRLGAPSQMATSPASRLPSSGPTASRRELLRVVLRDALRRHGIPADWITAEMLTATARDREPGLHWRLAIRHWDPRLPNLCVALQNSLVQRLQGFDPMASQWLLGISWQFALSDESQCPPLPHPGSWTAPGRDSAAAPAVQAAPAHCDVIAGPVQIAEGDASVKADLQKLMATLDAQYASAGRGYEATQPMYAATEPAKL